LTNSLTHIIAAYKAVIDYKNIDKVVNYSQFIGH
jgi:hypothetical protein